jgi:hypothetical protein
MNARPLSENRLYRDIIIYIYIDYRIYISKFERSVKFYISNFPHNHRNIHHFQTGIISWKRHLKRPSRSKSQVGGLPPIKPGRPVRKDDLHDLCMYGTYWRIYDMILYYICQLLVPFRKMENSPASLVSSF